MLDILLLSIIMVFIIDCSGIIDEMEKGLSKWLNCKAHIPKPFSCSLCMTWWSSLLYLIIVGKFTFMMIAYAALISYLTTVIYNLLMFVRDGLNKLINTLVKALNL